MAFALKNLASTVFMSLLVSTTVKMKMIKDQNRVSEVMKN